MPYYLSAPTMSIQFTENGTTHEHGSVDGSKEGIVENITCQAQKPAQFFDGGSGARYVVWGDLQGEASVEELVFSHSEATASALDLTTDDVIPDGFALEIKFGSNPSKPIAQFGECASQYDGPGVTTMGNQVFYQGTTTIRIYDPDITASP